MFGSLKSLKVCTPHISYWLICQETRNEVEFNAPRLSVLRLFGFRKMTYTPRRREYVRLATVGVTSAVTSSPTQQICLCVNELIN